MRCALLLCLATAAFAAPRCNDNIRLSIMVTDINIFNLDSVSFEMIRNLSGDAMKTMLDSLPTINTTGSYTIAGRYCKPEVLNPSRANTMQFLVHGEGYDRNYWSGLGLPGSTQQVSGTEYSWVDYASKQGYHTFSIDRICNGQSSHPEATLCQLSLNAATIHAIVVILRRGDVGGRSFDKIILVSFSLGSLIANVHSKLYPFDVDAYVLTSYSLRFIKAIADVIALYLPLPAAIVLPDRYGSLGLDYLVSSSRPGFERLFYYGAYSKFVVDIDYRGRGTVALGELLTALFGTNPVPTYTGHVFVLNGQHDQAFCSREELSVTLGVPADCGNGPDSVSSQVRVLYPNAKSFSWAQTPRTGHATDLHTTARVTFRTVHTWINSLFQG